MDSIAIDWTQVILFAVGWFVPTPIRLFFLLSPNSRLRALFSEINRMEDAVKEYSKQKEK